MQINFSKSKILGFQTLFNHKFYQRSSPLIARAENSDAISKVGREKTGLWFASNQSLGYLDGSLPGDFGFDPLGVYEPDGKGFALSPSWLQYSEVIHARWAMLGAVGCIAPEILGALGFIPADTAVVWFRSGVIPPAGSYEQYWSDPYTIFFVEVILMQFAELKRWQDYRNAGSQGKQYFLGIEKVLCGSGNPSYPGGPFFNVLGMGKTEAEANELKLKEIKNGRLAMLAMFGYGAQAVLTGKGPYENLADHLADPVNCNILTNFGHPFGQ
jgi:light-harvesting complex I chlorophyll a/b binding protein 3